MKRYNKTIHNFEMEKTASYKLSRRDIRFLEIAYAIGNFFGLFPSYNFAKGTVTRPQIDRIRAVFMIATMVICVPYSVYLQIQYSPKTTIVKHVIIRTTEFLTVSIDSSIILGSAFYSRKHWVKMNNNFCLIDTKLNNNNKTNKSFLVNPYFQMASCTLLYLINVINAYYDPMLKDGFIVFRAYFMADFCFYLGLFSRMIIYNLTETFRLRYQDFNKLITLTSYQKNPNFIKETTKFSRKLTETLEAFNKIFGWPLLFINAATIGDFVLAIYYIMSHLTATPRYFSSHYFVPDLFIAAIMLVPALFITMSCDGVWADNRRTLALCKKLERNFAKNSKEREELHRLVLNIERNTTAISAAKFFEINRRLLLSIMSTTTSYLIVVIQFTHF